MNFKLYQIKIDWIKLDHSNKSNLKLDLVFLLKTITTIFFKFLKKKSKQYNFLLSYIYPLFIATEDVALITLIIIIKNTKLFPTRSIFYL